MPVPPKSVPSGRTLSCDTLVALPGATSDGSTLFGKNSDRPASECQPLIQVPPGRHRPGARLRCQYLEIPQVSETHGFVGSQPYWLWGLEHGVNDCRLAISNEAVFTHDLVPETGLLGMDLVRLGLERAETAHQAVEVITALLEAYGQGGSAHAGTTFGYHNSFLLADPAEAWILETSGRRWAAREVDGIGSISNHLTIEEDWDLASADLEGYAVKQGWWSPEGGRRFSFAGAYRSTALMPAFFSEGRLACGRELLAAAAGRLTSQRLMSFLRYHGGGNGLPPLERELQDPARYTLCLHADPLGTTTASMVARLRASPDGRPDLWACLGAPCTGVYLPVYLDGDLPAVLSLGGAEPDAASPWWRFKALQDEVLAGPREDFVRLRAFWSAWEGELLAESERLAEEVGALLRAGDAAGARRATSAFMARSVDEALRQLDAWRAEKGTGGSAGGSQSRVRLTE